MPTICQIWGVGVMLPIRHWLRSIAGVGKIWGITSDGSEVGQI